MRPMRVAETSGKTVEEAIGRALDQLGLRRDQVDVDVITEGRAGFLGFGSEDAIVRVSAKDAVLTQGPRGGGRQRGGRGRGDGRGRGQPQGAPRESPGARPESMRDEPAVDESPARASDDEGGERRRGRRGGRGRGRGGAGGERMERPAAGPGRFDGPRRDRSEPRESTPRDQIRAVSPHDQVRIPGTPDDLPLQPKSDPVDEVDLAGSTLRDILTLLGLSATEISARDPESPGDGIGLIEQVFDIYGEDEETSDDLGVLIGRRGETLQSLQYLVNTIAAQGGSKPPVFGIDIEGYRRRREQMLVELAREIAQEVRETGDVITLEPMPPAERRIVHLALQEEPGVRTESVGSGDRRQVEVMPAE